MKVFKCPECNSLLDVYVGVLRPWEAVAAEMLEKGIVLHCSGCHTRNFDISDIVCPQCNEKKLDSSLLDQLFIQQIPQKFEGIISCTNCDFKIYV